MPYQVDNACYETLGQAAAARLATIQPVATETHLIRAKSSDEFGGIQYEYYNVQASTVAYYTQGYAPPPCQMLTTADAVAVGWLIGGVWVSISLVTFLIRYLRGETESIDASHS